MKYKDRVIKEILKANPLIGEGDVITHNRHATITCKHGYLHIVYSEDGDPLYSPDDCPIVGIEPIQELKLSRCEMCNTITPKEMLSRFGLCPICDEK